jgi:hypothetical protein
MINPPALPARPITRRPTVSIAPLREARYGRDDPSKRTERLSALHPVGANPNAFVGRRLVPRLEGTLFVAL